MRRRKKKRSFDRKFAFSRWNCIGSAAGILSIFCCKHLKAMTLCPLNGHCDGFYNLLILCHSFYGLKMQQNEIRNIHNSHCDSHTHTQIAIHTHNNAPHWMMMLKICAFNIQNGMRKSIIFTRTNGQTNNRTAPEILDRRFQPKRK